MKLINLHQGLFNKDNLPQILTYTFTPQNGSFNNDSKLRIRKIIPALEHLIEYEYGNNNFIKNQINNISENLIQTGTQYVKKTNPLLKIIPIIKPKQLITEIVYDLFKEENQDRGYITLITKGTDTNLMSHIYDHIRNMPGLEIESGIQRQLKEVDASLIGGYTPKLLKINTAKHDEFKVPKTRYEHAI